MDDPAREMACLFGKQQAPRIIAHLVIIMPEQFVTAGMPGMEGDQVIEELLELAPSGSGARLSRAESMNMAVEEIMK